MPLQTLPNEIFLLICECLPCHSRAKFVRLNKQIRDVCNPLLYRTVFLPTRNRVLSLQSTLVRRPELGGHVRHILFSDRNSDEFHPVLPDFVICWPATHSERLLRRQRIRDWLQERDKELAAFRAALREILSLVAPHLISLTLLHYEHTIRSLGHLLNLPYPKLKELTIRGDYPPLPDSMNIPSLERLHLAAGDMPNPWASFSAITTGCPNLTHLRITEPLSCILTGSVLANALEVSLGVCDEYDPESLGLDCEHRRDGSVYTPPRPCLPSTLQELQLQPYPPDLTGIGTPHPDHVEMMGKLLELNKSVDIFKLIPANGENYKLPYSFEIACNDWNNRINGGAGCWRAAKLKEQ
ncbi:hypothetical protein SCHPADRAFT_693032 [Schizopora paradoxa]|uniref:F-box domain-containing protein n=1 Tax=Schizopora paradoxa TaxID=27342 RepID=A0A0H2R3F5_9AGAM|nr:hypothetical protein SCHPADRAFT_693032 [Schizopora paradoxa]